MDQFENVSIKCLCLHVQDKEKIMGGTYVSQNGKINKKYNKNGNRKVDRK